MWAAWCLLKQQLSFGFAHWPACLKLAWSSLFFEFPPPLLLYCRVLSTATKKPENEMSPLWALCCRNGGTSSSGLDLVMHCQKQKKEMWKYEIPFSIFWIYVTKTKLPIWVLLKLYYCGRWEAGVISPNLSSVICVLTNSCNKITVHVVKDTFLIPLRVVEKQNEFVFHIFFG